MSCVTSRLDGPPVLSISYTLTRFPICSKEDTEQRIRLANQVILFVHLVALTNSDLSDRYLVHSKVFRGKLTEGTHSTAS